MKLLSHPPQESLHISLYRRFNVQVLHVACLGPVVSGSSCRSSRTSTKRCPFCLGGRVGSSPKRSYGRCSLSLRRLIFLFFLAGNTRHFGCTVGGETTERRLTKHRCSDGLDALALRLFKARDAEVRNCFQVRFLRAAYFTGHTVSRRILHAMQSSEACFVDCADLTSERPAPKPFTSQSCDLFEDLLSSCRRRWSVSGPLWSGRSPWSSWCRGVARVSACKLRFSNLGWRSERSKGSGCSTRA